VTHAYLSLGGNLGDPRRQMAEALQVLEAEPGHSVLDVSPLYRTPPWGKTDQPDFLNACAAIFTTLSPTAFLTLCLDVEQRLHRRRGERWGPRTIDLDILDFGGQIVAEEALQLPHPRMLDRAFVLLPLSRIAPDLRIAGRTIGSWLAEVPQDGIEIADEASDWWRPPLSPPAMPA